MRDPGLDVFAKQLSFLRKRKVKLRECKNGETRIIVYSKPIKLSFIKSIKKSIKFKRYRRLPSKLRLLKSI